MLTIPIGMPGAGGYREHDILIVNEDGAENITKYPLGPEHNIIGSLWFHGLVLMPLSILLSLLHFLFLFDENDSQIVKGANLPLEYLIGHWM